MLRLFAALLLILMLCASVSGQSAPAQRLADDQHRLAEQTRRLETLLGNLEQTAREEGEEDRAALLAGARARLVGESAAQDMVGALERIAAELTQEKWGQAVEEQEKALLALESLLDYLLRRQQQERMESLEAMLRDYAERLLDAVVEQSRLLSETQDLQAEGATPADPGQTQKEQTQTQKALAEAQAELAEAQAELAEALAEQAEANPVPQAEDPTQKAADSAAEAAEALGQTDAESLEEAIAAQIKVLESLQNAAQQAQDDAARLESMQRQEQLLDLATQAAALLERHLQVQIPMALFSQELGGQLADRRQRSQLRSWSKEEAALATAAQDLLAAVQVGGADTIPFFLRGLAEGHRQLGDDLGAPRFRASDLQVSRGQDLVVDWQELIAIIEAEAERERQKLEAPAGPNQSSPSGMASLAEDLQLLKRLQGRLGDHLQGFARRRQALQAAGIPLDAEDLAEMELLLARQTALRELYEDILARLEEASRGESEVDPNAEEEEFF